MASKPLIRVVTFAPEGQDKMLLQVKYEKLPRFCAHCGLMGHVHLECGAGEYAEKDLQFGGWMIAEADTWHPGTPRFRSSLPDEREGPRDGAGRGDGMRRTGRGGRAAWGGRGQAGGRNPMWQAKEKSESISTGSKKRNSTEVSGEDREDQDLTDTAMSPHKPQATMPVQAEESSAARKKLVLNGEAGVPPLPEQYRSPRDIKRVRHVENKKSLETTTEKAGSSEEHRQQQ